MAKNIFISFPYDEQWQMKNKIANLLIGLGIGVDYSEKEDRSNLTDETIWNHLLKRIKGSSITIVVHDPSLTNWKAKGLCDSSSYPISERFHRSGWIYKEIVGSLRDWEENRINGIIYLVPNNYWYQFSYPNDYRNLVPEIIYQNLKRGNFNAYSSAISYATNSNSGFIEIVSESDFFNNPYKFIDSAYQRREDQINYERFRICKNLHLN